MSTESIDPRYRDIDQWPTRQAIEAMLDGQIAAVTSVRSQIDALARAADAASERLLEGGRLVYVGAGTSGRIAVQDGVELVPTYDFPAERLVYVLAGGMAALSASVEGAEDDIADAERQMTAAGITDKDVVIGVAASGITPFTVAALRLARLARALTIGITNNQDAPLTREAEVGLVADTGSELVAGSTRMKAGTAQKTILNVLSTMIMLRCGFIYNGLMVNMRASNQKLRKRAIEMVQELSGKSQDQAEAALEQSDYDIKLAVLLALGCERSKAASALSSSRNNLRAALQALGL